MSFELARFGSPPPDRNRVVGRLDPRLPLLATVSFIVVVTTMPGGAWVSFCLGAGLVTVTILALRLTAWSLYVRALAVLPIAALASVSILFTRHGATLFSVPFPGGGLVATHEGAVAAVSLVVKAYLSILMSATLVRALGFNRVVDAMRALRVPGVLTQTIAFTYRYLQVLMAEASRMQTARESRSAGSGRTILWRARVLGAMIGTLFLRSFSRSERIYHAMQARGFHGEIVALSRTRWTARDTAWALVWSSFLVGIALASRLGGG